MKIAVILSHPVQYYVPWFRQLSTRDDTNLKVFYLWDRRTSGDFDPDFNSEVKWDTDLYSGYEYEFVKNVSLNPGSSTFTGLMNPSLPARIADYQPDAVLMYGYRYVSHLLLLSSRKLKNTPYLLRGDSHLIAGVPSWLKSFLLRQIFSRFQAFLSVGSANRSYFKTFGVSEEKIFHCPHAVDLSHFSTTRVVEEQADRLRQKLGIVDGSFVFLYAGKFTEKKQVLQLMDAFLRLNDKQAVLVMAGSGNLEEEVREKASASRQIHVCPFVNQSEMPALYSIANVFVLPSKSAYETWGLSVQEALAMQVPVLVSDEVGCAEDLVLPDETGWIFRAGDVYELAAKLKQVLEKKNSTLELGKAGRVLVESSYSYEQSTEGLLAAMNYLATLK